MLFVDIIRETIISFLQAAWSSLTSNPAANAVRYRLDLNKSRDDSIGHCKAFPFLLLPGEVRNMIYEYAFTSPSGRLQYRAPLSSESCLSATMRVDSITPATGHQPFNQLQYVNKQLRAETADGSLCLRHNTLHFDYYPPSDRTASAQLIVFLNLLLSKGFTWPVSIIMNDFDPLVTRPNHFCEEPSTIIELARLCEALPSVTVRYVLSEWTDFDRWNQNPSNLIPGQAMFLYRGTYYETALRKSKGPWKVRAMNLRFMPKEGVNTDAEVWRTHVMSARATNGGHIWDPDRAAELVDEWVANGI